MKAISIEALRQIQLRLLKCVDTICVENNLHYSLCGGTLIGAIRHKGYIPWDDDIDVMFPRGDYEQFIKIAGRRLPNNLAVYTCFNKQDYYYPFAKLVDTTTILEEPCDRLFEGLGVYVDLFPCDGLPNVEKKRNAYWSVIRIWKRLNTMVYQKTAKGESLPKRLLRKSVFFLYRFKSKSSLAKKINRLAMQNSFATSEYVACSVAGYGMKEQIRKTVFDSYIDVPFEGEIFKSFSGYDEYLHSLYGDYMQFPPEDKRVFRHQFKAWYK